MIVNPAPRQIVEALLQGIPPPRPLWVPIVFSHGARMENLPLRTFLGNATKISNSLRQIRSYVRSDSISCYFDPFLEVEALGGRLEWDSEDQIPTLCWPGHAAKGEMPEDLRSPVEAVKSGRVSVAIEVIRRLKTLVRDDSLLMAGVTGPFTLAARIAQMADDDALRSEHFPDAALEIATSMMTKTSAAFVEAGANLIFIQEEILPPLSLASSEVWASRLAPAVNIIRFYQALPVLQLTKAASFADNSDVILQQHWDCVLCHTLNPALGPSIKVSPPQDSMLGIALPPDAFRPDETSDDDLDEFLNYAMSDLPPAMLTTADDVPVGTDMKRLIKVSDCLHP